MRTSPASAKAAAAPKGAKAATAAQPCVRFRLRVTIGETVAIGPGKIALLEAIDRHGSITAAAKSLAMSYRRAWLLVDAINASLKRPAVRSDKGGERGGGSVLTDVGHELVALYRRIETEACRACDADLRGLLRLLAK